jgi:hypothetical protein
LTDKKEERKRSSVEREGIEGLDKWGGEPAPSIAETTQTIERL